MSENPFPLNISEKEDSWSRIQLLSSTGAQFKLPATEFNKLVKAAEFLYENIGGLPFTGTPPVRTFQTLDQLIAFGPVPEEGTPAKVANDPTASKNGFYSVSGGEWVFDAPLNNGEIAEGDFRSVSGDKIARKALGRFPFSPSATFSNSDLALTKAIIDLKIYGGNSNWRVAPFTIHRNVSNLHYIRFAVYDENDERVASIGDNGIIGIFIEENYTEPQLINGTRIEKLTCVINPEVYDVDKIELLIDWEALDPGVSYSAPSYVEAGFDSKVFELNKLNDYIKADQILSEIPESEHNFWDSESTFSIIPEVKQAVLDIKLFGNIDISKDYAIRQWRYDNTGGRNFIGVWEFNAETGVVGNRVALWDENPSYDYPEAQGGRQITTITLEEDNASGITVQLTIDFAKLPPGVLTVSNQPVNVFKFSKKLLLSVGQSHLVGNATLDFQINGVNSRITTPTSYDSKGSASHCLMFIHGNNGDETKQGSTLFKNFCKDNNIAIISTNGQDESAAPFSSNASGWGNYVHLQRYIALYNYCQSNFNLTSNVIIVCGSMGGLVSGQLLYNKPFPITACFMAGPVPDLSYIFANGGSTRKEPIRNAYGMAENGTDDAQLEEFIKGYDWFDLGLIDVAGTKYKLGFPKLYITVGTGDGTFTNDFGGSSKYNEIITALENAGQFVYYKELPGVSHADDTCYDDWITNNLINKELGF